ncbi:MAG: SRPBCC family protein [Actinobacteria bacterium]|nr:SRPBCC family protein [Actinomycetota bacterium]
MPLIETSFEVPSDTETVWAYLLDIEKVVPCMPGAELTETIDETHWKGKMKLKLGPVTLNFAGKVSMEERDDEAHKVVLDTSAMEQRGKGAASATVTSTMEAFEGGTRVHVAQDIKVSGQAAQFSRGMMEDVATKIVHRFADCLKEQMEAEGVAASEAAAGDGAAGASEGAGSPAPAPQAQGRSEPAPAPARPAPARSVPTPSRAAPAELDATRLIAAAAGKAVLRALSRIFAGVSSAFGWVARSLERIAGG